MKNILVIDDSSEVRLIISSTLVQAGYTVRQARNGREGIQMIIARPPDLIICDVKMPELDGYHALEAVRKCSGTAAIPFILMTGSMGPNDFRRGMVSGADDYLMKPFTPEELKAAVKSRFDRLTDVQLDICQRVEKRHIEEFSQLSREIPASIHAIRSIDGNERRPKSAAREIEVSDSYLNLPVFCLD